MIKLDDVVKLCTRLIEETKKFDPIVFKNIKSQLNFNLDKNPVKPESTDRLLKLGGYPQEALQLLKDVGSITLNSSCYFYPNGELEEMSDVVYFKNLASNIGLNPDGLRILGGDHGEGRWGLIIESGTIIFFEVDDDYFGKTPSACFNDFFGWFRTNFILGIIEDYLEQKGVDIYDEVPIDFSNKLLRALSSIDSALNSETWPYKMLYPLE